MRPDEMMVKAKHCDEMAGRAINSMIAATLRDLAYQWRDMAAQKDDLELQCTALRLEALQ